MTNPIAPGTRTLQLAQPVFPMLALVVSDPIFPTELRQSAGCPHCGKEFQLARPVDDSKQPITWTTGRPHPFIKNFTVVRMFRDDLLNVEVYSAAVNGEGAMRDMIPVDKIRLAQEAMPVEVLVDLIAEAETDKEEDFGDEEGVDEGEGSPEAAPPSAASTAVS